MEYSLSPPYLRPQGSGDTQVDANRQKRRVQIFKHQLWIREVAPVIQAKTNGVRRKILNLLLLARVLIIAYTI